MKHITCTIIEIKKVAADPAAIRQVGIVKYIDSKVVWKYTIRVDPDETDGAHTFEGLSPCIEAQRRGER